jgi:hypothetical protein
MNTSTSGARLPLEIDGFDMPPDDIQTRAVWRIGPRFSLAVP